MFVRDLWEISANRSSGRTGWTRLGVPHGTYIPKLTHSGVNATDPRSSLSTRVKKILTRTTYINSTCWHRDPNKPEVIQCRKRKAGSSASASSKVNRNNTHIDVLPSSSQRPCPCVGLHFMLEVRQPRPKLCVPHSRSSQFLVASSCIWC